MALRGILGLALFSHTFRASSSSLPEPDTGNLGCLTTKPEGCLAIKDKLTCLSSVDGSEPSNALQSKRQPCVWCGGAQCTNSGDSLCAPYSFLEKAGTVFQHMISLTLTVAKCHGTDDDLGDLSCLKAAPQGCHTLKDWQNCTFSKDARPHEYIAGLRVKDQPCVWCAGGLCHDGAPNRCEAYDFLLNGKGHAFNTRYNQGVWTRSSCNADHKPWPVALPSSTKEHDTSNEKLQSMYLQCGGVNWKGSTRCESGAACHPINPYYSQCMPTGRVASPDRWWIKEKPSAEDMACLKPVAKGCSSQRTHWGCLSSKDDRAGLDTETLKVGGEPCVWCGGGVCSTYSDSLCEPYDWLMKGEGSAFTTLHAKGTYTVAKCYNDHDAVFGNMKCLKKVNDGCNSLRDANSCLAAVDGRSIDRIAGLRVSGQPCVWCGGVHCHEKSSSLCEPYDFAVYGEGIAFSSFHSKLTYMVAGCEQGHPISHAQPDYMARFGATKKVDCGNPMPTWTRVSKMCNQCEVLVPNIRDMYSTCKAYCAAQGIGCADAAITYSHSCDIRKRATCDTEFEAGDYARCHCDPAAVPVVIVARDIGVGVGGTTDSTKSELGAATPPALSNLSKPGVVCSAHPACTQLRLGGNCCPNDAGVRLDCCLPAAISGGCHGQEATVSEESSAVVAGMVAANLAKSQGESGEEQAAKAGAAAAAASKAGGGTAAEQAADAGLAASKAARAAGMSPEEQIAAAAKAAGLVAIAAGLTPEQALESATKAAEAAAKAACLTAGQADRAVGSAVAAYKENITLTKKQVQMAAMVPAKLIGKSPGEKIKVVAEAAAKAAARAGVPGAEIVQAAAAAACKAAKAAKMSKPEQVAWAGQAAADAATSAGLLPHEKPEAVKKAVLQAGRAANISLLADRMSPVKAAAAAAAAAGLLGPMDVYYGVMGSVEAISPNEKADAIAHAADKAAAELKQSSTFAAKDAANGAKALDLPPKQQVDAIALAASHGASSPDQGAKAAGDAAKAAGLSPQQQREAIAQAAAYGTNPIEAAAAGAAGAADLAAPEQALAIGSAAGLAAGPSGQNTLNAALAAGDAAKAVGLSKDDRGVAIGEAAGVSESEEMKIGKPETESIDEGSALAARAAKMQGLSKMSQSAAISEAAGTSAASAIEQGQAAEIGISAAAAAAATASRGLDLDDDAKAETISKAKETAEHVAESEMEDEGLLTKRTDSAAEEAAQDIQTDDDASKDAGEGGFSAGQWGLIAAAGLAVLGAGGASYYLSGAGSSRANKLTKKELKDEESGTRTRSYQVLPAGAQTAFDAADTNHDGVLSREEFTAMQQQMAAGSLHAPMVNLNQQPSQSSQQRSLHYVAPAQAAGIQSGQYSVRSVAGVPVQYAAVPFQGARIQTRGATSHAPTAASALPGTSLFRQLDRNHDGVLSRQEFRPMEIFNAADTNHDGALSREEFTAMQQQMAAGAGSSEAGNASS